MERRYNWKRILLVVIFLCVILAYIVSVIVRMVDTQRMSKKQEEYDALAVNALKIQQFAQEPELIRPDAFVSKIELDTEKPSIGVPIVEEPEAEIEVDFQYLWEQNKDIVAWMTIPDTEIDYPILQGSNNQYYLEYNIDGTKGRPGCIYLDSYNDSYFGDALSVVYGHNMRNGTMFGTLKDFQKKDYFDAHRDLILYLPERKLHYEIIMASEYSNEYLFIDRMSQESDGEYYFMAMDGQEGVEFILKLMAYKDKKANKVEHLYVDEDDNLLVLSTCCRDTTKRLLIVCKEVQ